MFASKLPVSIACFALLVHVGCALIEPVPPDAQVPEPDASRALDEQSEPETLSDQLASDEAPAQPTPIAPDAETLVADGGQANIADADARCEADWQCAASEYCSRVRGVCSARCQGDTCLGPTFSDTNDRLVSDGVRVCFADDSEAPGSGDFALRTWDGVAPRATTLTRAHEVRALLLDDHYCYFHAAGALRRAALSGGCVELVQEMAAPPSRIWSHEGHVSWSAAVGEVLRITPQQNAHAEHVESSDAAIPSEHTYATSVTAGGRLIQRHAAEGRLQAEAIR